MSIILRRALRAAGAGTAYGHPPLVGTMLRTVAGVFLALLLAAAFSPPARAGDVCGAEPDHTQTLADLQVFLLGHTPAKFAGLAHATLVKEVDSDETFGPSAVAKTGEAFEIDIPRDFFQIHCELVMLTFLMVDEADDGPDRRRIQEGVNHCIESGEGPYDCVGGVIDTAYESKRQQIEAMSDNDQETARGFIRNAMTSLVLHEFGHIALGHVLRERRPSDEIDADIFASIYITISGGVPTASYYNFYILSVLDPLVLQGLDSHGRFACRAASADIVAAAVGLGPMAIMSLAGSGSVSPQEARIEITKLSTAPPERLPSNENCPSMVSPQLDSLQTDVRTLIHFLSPRYDLLDKALQGADSSADFLAQLEALHMKTDVGRAMHLEFASQILRTAMENTPTTSHVTFTPAIDRILDADPQHDISSASFGRLIGSKAIEAYYANPPGTLRSDVIARFRPWFAEALYYNQGFSEVYLLAGEVELFDEKCDAGMDFLRHSIETSTDDTQKGDAQSVVNSLDQVLKQSGCPALGAVARKYFPSQDSGWIP